MEHKCHFKLTHLLLLLFIFLEYSRCSPNLRKDTNNELSTEQCQRLDKFVEKSGVESVMYLDSCEARFIKIDRLYDGSLLLFISMKGWAKANSTELQLNERKLQNKISLNYGKAALVIRLEGCTIQKGSIEVRLNPPHKLPNKTMPRVRIHNGTGEQFLVDFPVPENLNLQLAEGKAKNRTKCLLANSYLAVCLQDLHTACPVILVDSKQKLVSCDCRKLTSNYVHSGFCLGVLVLMLIFGFAWKKVETEMDGFSEEEVTGSVVSNARAYHYQAIFRVACPTATFNSQKSSIHLQLLGANYREICAKASVSLTNHQNIKWNILTVNMFLPRLLPKVKAVRVRHEGGTPNTGIFLFDVQVKFIEGPEKPNTASLDEADPWSMIRLKSVNEDSIHDQRLVICAYIPDHDCVYDKLKKRYSIEMPPMAYPEMNHVFLKTLVWLAVTQVIFLAVHLLDYAYLKFDMIIVSIGVALFISVILLLEISFFAWLHVFLAMKSFCFTLWYKWLSSSNTKKSFCNCNCSKILGRVLSIFLVLLVVASIVAIGLKCMQPVDKALFIQAISGLSLVLLGGISWLVYGSINKWPLFMGDRLITEKRLMEESHRRAICSSAYNESFTKSNAEHSLLTTSPWEATTATAIIKGSFEMFSK